MEMEGVTSDWDDLEYKKINTSLPMDATVKLSERTDEETIKKTNQTFMVILYQVMPMILASQHQSSEKSKEEIHRLEEGIKKSTLTAAGLQKDLGWNGIYTAGGVMAVSLLQFISGCNETDKQIAQMVADKVAPNFFGLFKSGIEGNLTQANNRYGLLNNKYNLQATQEQAKGNQRQQAEAVVDKANRLLEGASRAGG